MKASQAPVVLHIARNPVTGVWSAMKALARAQQRAGYRVRFGLLLSKKWPHRAELASLRVETWTSSSPEIFGTAAFLLHETLANPVPTWVNTMAAGQAPARLVLHYHNAWLAGALVIPYSPNVMQVSTFHGFAARATLPMQPVRRAIHRRWAKRLVNRRVRLVSVDAATSFTAGDVLGLDPALFRIVPNGVDAPVIKYPRSRCAVIGGRLLVGHVGTLNEGKGWRVTAEAVRHVAARGVPIHYLIAGSGAEACNARDWCRANPSIATYLGNVTDAASELMPQLDVLCLPTNNDGLPMSVLEAMASGVVVIATRVGGIPDAVADGRTGFLVERDPGAIAEKLAFLAENPALLAKMSEEAARRHLAKFTSEAMCRGYADVYKDWGD